MYNTEVFEGGATVFYAQTGGHHTKIEPKTGRVLLFQHANTSHAGEEVLHGTKYTMRTDLMYALDKS